MAEAPMASEQVTASLQAAVESCAKAIYNFRQRSSLPPVVKRMELDEQGNQAVLNDRLDEAKCALAEHQAAVAQAAAVGSDCRVHARQDLCS